VSRNSKRGSPLRRFTSVSDSEADFIAFRLEGLQGLFDFTVTGSDQLLVMTECLQRLAERDQVLAAVVSDQRLGDRIRAGLDPPVA
jgi:hypothetical protein